ncbi:hypothetical protein C8R43DRAFT_1017119 [Mycena crocata]|nr:hypothetical protein C8R43DRAFT_1017119 [Mycena crocata]
MRLALGSLNLVVLAAFLPQISAGIPGLKPVAVSVDVKRASWVTEKQVLPPSLRPRCLDDDDDDTCEQAAHTTSSGQSQSTFFVRELTTPCTESQPRSQSPSSTLSGSTASAPHATQPSDVNGAESPTRNNTQELKNKARAQPAIVALACILSALIVAIGVFFLWRELVRRKRRRTPTYIDLSEGESEIGQVDSKSELLVPLPVPVSAPLQVQDRPMQGPDGALPHPPSLMPHTYTVPNTPLHPAFRTQRTLAPSRSVQYFRTFTDLRRQEQEKQAVRVAEGGPLHDEDDNLGILPPGYRSTETILLR